ncbi:MAG TPA: hypothetical protein VFF43_03520 [Caldimonas sp.]|jgi:hypothetical protein|nr:hypothetical protein [Caldimonas sp.]
MTFPRMLSWLVAAAATVASTSSLAGEPPAPAASAPPARSAEATKARQEADRQRLIAKLRADAPKTTEKQKGSVLDLPIFNRHNSP